MDYLFGSIRSDCSSFCSNMRQVAGLKSWARTAGPWRQGQQMRAESKRERRVQPGLRDPFTSER